MAAAAAIPQEEQWMTNFVHSDVHKDHKAGYRQDIVQEFLPAGAPYVGNIVSKEDLFGRLVGGLGFYEFLRGIADRGNHGSIALNLFDNATYEYRVFSKDDFKKSDVVQEIQTATRGTLGEGVSFLKISDTTNHTDDIHRLWDNATNPIIQARTRAVQMDAALKMTSKNVGNDAMFYIEGAPPDNTGAVLYPSYYTENKLSYLYCKYPVYIKHNGVKGDKYTLKVGLSYNKNNKAVDIDGDLNTAGFMFKIVEKLGRCFGMSNHDILEAGYIGKHSGDVLQVLDAFRDINLVHYTGNNRPYQHKAGAPSIFETIDINAASKAFSTGVYCIWLHLNGKLVVFTKVIDNLQYLKNKYTILYNAVKFKFGLLPQVMHTLDTNRDQLLEMIQVCNTQFETIMTSTPIMSATDDLYKQFLKTCAQYSLFYEKLPLLLERIRDLDRKNTEIIELQQNQTRVLDILDSEQNENVYRIVIAQLEEFDRLLTPFTNLDDEIAEMRNLLDRTQHIEFNDLILNQRNEITYASAFDCINLYQEAGRSKRILADKTSSAYGLDIINMTYKKLSIQMPNTVPGIQGVVEDVAPVGSDPKHVRFIQELYRRVPEGKKEMFISLLRSIGIPSPVLEGGSRKTLKKNNRKLRRTYKQKGGNKELVQEILETLSFFANIYRDENENHLRNYIIHKLGESVSVPKTEFESTDTSKVILNIMDTYEDIADNLQSDMLKIMLTLVEDIELYKTYEPTVKKQSSALIKLGKAPKASRNAPKGPKVSSKKPDRLTEMEAQRKLRNSIRQSAIRQIHTIMLRKTRKKLRE